MPAFTRIKAESAGDMSTIALNHGLEHDILPFPGDKFSDWVTFQFTTDHSKRKFEELCSENDVSIDGHQIVHSMVDDVVSGESASSVVEGVVTKKMTKGMANAFGKMNTRIKYRCKHCDMAIPVYSGAYPKSCPECSSELTHVK